MTCCTHYCAAEAQFGSARAQSDLRQYQRRGPIGVTRVLLAELRRRPLQDKQLLDVGAGISVISAELAGSGLAGTTVAEASPPYLEVARQVVEPRYRSGASRFVLGDFALLAETLPDADVVTLDRVVCCYPDANALLQAAASKTRQLLVFTYPRDRWDVRAVVALQNLWRRIKGGTFRVFVHPAKEMRAAVERNGLVRIARRGTFIWVVDVYGRAPA